MQDDEKGSIFPKIEPTKQGSTLHASILRAAKYDKARDDAKLVWPWLGLDREIPADFVRERQISKMDQINLLGVIEYDKITDWLAENKESVTGEFLLRLTGIAHKEGQAYAKSRLATLKNAKARAWVLTEWENCPDKKQSKAAFSRVYALLVKNKFKLNITADTITRDWLPKEKPSP